MIALDTLPAPIGGSEWCTSHREALASIVRHRIDAIDAARLAHADFPFTGCPAPSGIGEACESYSASIGGMRGDAAPTPMRLRGCIATARVAGKARAARRAALRAARMRESYRRRVAALQRPSVALIDPYILRIDRNPRPLDRISACEEHILNRDRETAAWRTIAASEPSHDGRGNGDRTAPGIAVNGRETRVASRWHSSRRDSILIANDNYSETIDPDTGYIASREGDRPDWGCYRINPDGSRTALVSTATARKRKARKHTATALDSDRADRDAAARERVAARIIALGSELVADGSFAA